MWITTCIHASFIPLFRYFYGRNFIASQFQLQHLWKIVFFFFVNFRKRKFAKLKTYPPLFVCSLHQMRLAFARDSHQAEVYAISANCRMHIHKNPRTDPRRRSCSLLSSYLFNIVKKTTSIFLKLFHSPPSFQFRKLYQSLCIPSLNSLVSRYRSLWHRWKLLKKICVIINEMIIFKLYILVIYVYVINYCKWNDRILDKIIDVCYFIYIRE